MKSFKFTGVLWHVVCVNQWLDLQLKRWAFDLIFIISKIKAGFTLMRREKYHRCGTKRKRMRVSCGGNAFSNLEFSVWCKLVTVILWKGLFRIGLPECCLSTLLWVPDQHLAYSSVGNHPAERDKRFRHNFRRQQFNSLYASFVPSGSSRWSNPAVCWTEWLRSPSSECWQREGDNRRSHLTAGENTQDPPNISNQSTLLLSLLGWQ